MDLSVLIFVIVIALFIRFAVAVFKSAGSSSSNDQNAQVRRAIEAMRSRPRTGPPPTPAYQAPPPAYQAPPPAYQPPPPLEPDADEVAEASGILSGPQLVSLTPDQQRRVLAYMDQGYEVMAVRLVCDETRAGILDAQKTVRTLVGLPSPY